MSLTNNYPTFTYDDLHRAPTMEELKMFFPRYAVYEELFSEEIRDQARHSITLGDITSRREVPMEDIGYYKKQGYPVLNTQPHYWEFEEWKGEWMRKVKKLAYTFLVPTQYHSFGSEFTKECINLAQPICRAFKFEVYNLERNNWDIYLKTEDNGSVYVPVDALLRGDVGAIVKHHTDYYTRYYRWPGGWGPTVTEEMVLEMRRQALSSLDSPTFKRFADALRNTHAKQEGVNND